MVRDPAGDRVGHPIHTVVDAAAGHIAAAAVQTEKPGIGSLGQEQEHRCILLAGVAHTAAVGAVDVAGMAVAGALVDLLAGKVEKVPLVADNYVAAGLQRHIHSSHMGWAWLPLRLNSASKVQLGQAEMQSGSHRVERE